MIGIFDSGLGGLTVLKEIKRVLPEYDYMYLGDTLHVPYGNRSDEAVYDLTRKACDYLFDNGLKLIILACNTATSKALRRLQTEHLPARQARRARLARQVKENILGVVRPMAEEVNRIGKDPVGVIGTRGTVNSNVYMVELKEQGAKIKEQSKSKDQSLKTKEETGIVQRACPLLVPMIEEGWDRRKEIKSVLRYYLRPLKQAKVKVLILGCTHYPLLIKQIKSIMGPSCFVPNPGEIVAKSLAEYLKRHAELEKGLTKNSQTRYLVTDLNDNFKKQAERFIEEKINIERVKY
ncbi:aspartate/glutamate racemase family protein [Candidatus Kuenenbacteria bacterium]|nr:aspartate/glutamate racemase family protein [Candidatus Kuenenbacteria bacterium]